MDTYNFWQDFLDTYQSLSDWMKFAWLVVPPALLLGFVALVTRYRPVSRRATGAEQGSLAYTVFADENGRLRICTPDGGDAPARAPSRRFGHLATAPCFRGLRGRRRMRENGRPFGARSAQRPRE